MKVWHTSDIHLSFKEDGSVQKPMDQRSWSKGSPNYVGYLDKLADFGKNTITENDLTIITGDLTHDMPHKKALKSFKWMRKSINGTIVVCAGNHDQAIKFQELRLNNLGDKFYLLDPNELLSIGNYTIGCYSDHKQMCDDGDRSPYLEMARRVVAMAKDKSTIPVMIGHYPVPVGDAKHLGQIGIKAYLSGHVHNTKGTEPGGVSWDWYDRIAKQTDDQFFSECFFSTGTTDVLLCKHKQIYKEITCLATTVLQGKKAISYKDIAAKMFKCATKQVASFENRDPFNPQNVITGYTCHHAGTFTGSLYITHVNGVPVNHDLIWGTPKLAYPYKQNTEEYGNLKPEAKFYYLANKYNGTNVLFYKYYDAQGNVFITAKTKGTAILKDGDYGNFFSLTNEALALKPNQNISNDIPPQLMALVKDDMQSISFELYGKKEPHLVKYNVDIKLQPLFYTYEDGKIEPHLDQPSPEYMAQPFHYNSSDYVTKICQFKQADDLETNESYRAKHNLKVKYEFEHFAVEGRVLYLLDDNMRVVDRTLYKIKPKDIEAVHWSNYDANMQKAVQEAVKKLGRDGMDVNEATLKEELDMGPKEWDKFGFHILKYLGLNPADDQRELLVLCGLPGSGKTTMAVALAAAGWTRVNQDEVGSRNKCKDMVIDAFKHNKKVVVDRCNFDVNQRKSWLEIAREFNVTNINCVHIDTPNGICKVRVVNRQDHPTVKPVEGSKIIVDKFANMFVLPNVSEGFKTVETISGVDNSMFDLVGRLVSEPKTAK